MDLLETLLGFVPVLIAATVVVAGLWAAGRLFDRWEQSGRATRFTRQLVLLALTVGGLVLVALTLPISPGEKGNLLSLIGIVLSAAIALSSTTLLGNILAGLMVRSLRRLRSGDFVESGEHFGRVTELGLLFTEIQTQDSSLYQIPNLFLVQRPLRIVRSQGTIVTADVSLGYDVPRQRVREALEAAAAEAGLEEPFVLISSLDDFSVAYRVGGLLQDVKTLVSTNSSLRAAMLDQLHQAQIEIVSPSFMNTRALQPQQRVIPEQEPSAPAQDRERAVEAIAFEKADAAEVLEALRSKLHRLEEEHEKLIERAKAARKGSKEGQPDQAEELQESLGKVEERIERLRTMIEAQSSQLES